ncbi:MAG TPA: ATP-binding protein [Vicinamibacterales bacterium]|nr:ATP-binding protein [Vicinamibacterales bacterium]
MSQIGTTSPPLISLLAAGSRTIDLLPHLHRYAIETTGGGCSLLFEHNPRSGALHPTSGYGLDELRVDPWSAGESEGTLIEQAFKRRGPMVVDDIARQMPDLKLRLGTANALLLPLAQGDERLGVLAIGFTNIPDPAEIGIDSIAVLDTFVTAMELLRLRRHSTLLRDLRDLIDEFSASISATLNLTAGLEIFCVGANRLFGADRTSVWVHDRRGRQLVLQGSSDPETISRNVRVSADDPLAPAAVAMRRSRAEITASGDEATYTVTVPLRGYRRALGTIVFESARIEAGGELELLDRADELGRQLSNAIETTQLLDDVIRSRRELENAFDSIWHLVVVVDRTGKIVQVNEAFANRLGRSREALLGQTLSECVGPELSSWVAGQQKEELRSDPTTPAMCELVDPALDGPFMFTVTDMVDQERRKTGMVLVARDLTPQSKLEVEREELRKRLTQSEKLAALGQFVAGIAHELNNPLQGVLGHLELLRVTGAFPKQLRKEVQTIYREADRAAKIVRNLLVFAGSRRLARRAVSLPPILQKVVALRSAACRAQDIEVVRHYEQKLPRVQSDPLLLHQVFLNIMMNAEQAIAATGRPGKIEITSKKTRDRLVTTVRDTGGGIPEEALSRIFEPFYTTKEVGKGTGLGLAIAYGIVQEHGGQILAANHPDGGAMFTVELPVGPAPDQVKE